MDSMVRMDFEADTLSEVTDAQQAGALVGPRYALPLLSALTRRVGKHDHDALGMACVVNTDLRQPLFFTSRIDGEFGWTEFVAEDVSVQKYPRRNPGRRTGRPNPAGGEEHGQA
jgi:hypothetical protein